jgi:exopolyphosphatase/guanosine-5'-triphosphate,3'-diphosphate pyrophosphatase
MTPDYEDRLFTVLQFAERCDYSAPHAHQVARLALNLFEMLAGLHHLGDEERALLHYGALLHDIGWVEGQGGHHKTSLRMILETPLPEVDDRTRLIVALLARYHRKALPSLRHEHYALLEQPDRRIVSTLAALLRVADGLDYTHQHLVRAISGQVRPGEVRLRCEAAAPADFECRAAMRKADLFQQVFSRKLVAAWHLI